MKNNQLDDSHNQTSNKNTQENIPQDSFSWFERIIKIMAAIASLGTAIALIVNTIKYPTLVRLLATCVYIIAVIFLFGPIRHVFQNKNLNFFWQKFSLILFCIITVIYFTWLGSWVFSQPSVTDYGIKITSPSDNTLVEGTVKVSGSYIKKPANDSFILVVKDADSSQYWPSSYTVQFDETLKEWNGEAYPSGNNKKYVIYAFTVGKSGRALYEYYKKVGKNTSGNWQSIVSLTDDYVECAHITVTTK
jgi:hypothetical protein